MRQPRQTCPHTRRAASEASQCRPQKKTKRQQLSPSSSIRSLDHFCASDRTLVHLSPCQRVVLVMVASPASDTWRMSSPSCCSPCRPRTAGMPALVTLEHERFRVTKLVIPATAEEARSRRCEGEGGVPVTHLVQGRNNKRRGRATVMEDGNTCMHSWM